MGSLKMKNIAFLNEDNLVVNTAAFDDDATDELIKIVCNANNGIKYYDQAIYGNTAIGGDFYNNKLWLPQPYPSWVRNEELNEWEPPIPYPTIEEGSDEVYIWDENTTSWLLLPPSN